MIARPQDHAGPYSSNRLFEWVMAIAMFLMAVTLALPGDSLDRGALRQLAEAGFSEDVETRGVEYRLESLLAYAKGIKSAHEAGQPFGIRIISEPDNKHDPLAMKVVGWSCAQGREEHLGYLPARMAYACHHRHEGKVLAARLVDLTLDIDAPKVLIDVLQQAP